MEEIISFTINRENKEAKTYSLKKKGVVILGLCATLIVGSLVVGSFLLYRSFTEQHELEVYRTQYAQQTERLEKLTADSERMQKELAQVATLEAQVRALLKKDGEQVSRGEIDRGSKELDNSGQGGYDYAVSPMDVLEVQNELMEKRIAYKKENLGNMLNQLSGRDGNPCLWPTEGGEISSYFGFRIDPFGGSYGDYHPGLDIANTYGAPIYAAAGGTVEMAQWNGGYGQYVSIAHENGMETAYGHMSAIAVVSGQTVRRGEVIGYVGSTGASTGPHVHFEVKENGEVVNPLRFVHPK